VVDRGVGTTQDGGATRGHGSWGARRRRWALFLGLVGCGTELPEDALHDALVGWFRREGIEVDGVRCPHALPQERDATVDCRVVVGSEEVEVTVVVTDDEGSLSVRPRHATVIAERAEPEIVQTLQGQGFDVASVGCDGRVWVARPGAEQRCEVVDGEGRRWTWIGVWSGEGTRQRTRVVPWPARSGGAG
jgi:hypothetical protein